MVGLIILDLSIASCKKNKERENLFLTDGQNTTIYKGRLSDSAGVLSFSPNHITQFQVVIKDSSRAYLHSHSINEFNIEYEKTLHDSMILPTYGWSRYAKYKNEKYGVLYFNWCHDSVKNITECLNSFTISDHKTFYFQAVLNEPYFSIHGDTSNFQMLKGLAKNGFSF
jgi:hypothetical protein